jgi:formyltetrahydrofolate deformylase
MRMEFDIALSAPERAELETRFAREVAEPLAMQWGMWDASVPKRVAILVSKEDHCLLDLLWRGRRGELQIDVPFVVSNHADLRADVESFGLRYEHIPVEPDGKREAERRLLELLQGEVDVVVLARYMQILSGELLDALAAPVINIHHSFLPAFAGAKPYAQAKRRGVKLIGATAHYVTEQLDDGPIIEQDTVRISHRDDVPAMMRLGADIERTVLARAVRWHCEDRVLRAGGTTVVF